MKIREVNKNKKQFVELRKSEFNRRNERNNVMDDNQRMKIRNFGYLNQGALKGQILFTGSSLMEMFPVCEIARSQGIERVIYNHGVLSCKSSPAMARQR